MRAYGSITSYDAIQKYGCTRLAAVIHELKKEGLAIERTDIVRRRTENGKNVNVVFGKYSLKEADDV